MATCLKHNQSYDETWGGYCPYCGKPTMETGATTTDICPEGGAHDFRTLDAGTADFVKCCKCGQRRYLMANDFTLSNGRGQIDVN